MLRQFHIEGFVNQYRMDSLSADKKTIVFLSEAFENIPEGFMARETYKIISQMNLLKPLKLQNQVDFAVYTEVRLKRK